MWAILFFLYPKGFFVIMSDMDVRWRLFDVVFFTEVFWYFAIVHSFLNCDL